MLNVLFYAVLGMLPWTCALIAALLVLRHFARAALSARCLLYTSKHLYQRRAIGLLLPAAQRVQRAAADVGAQ